MNDMLEQLLIHYKGRDPSEREQAIREIIQELVIYGLSSAGFFNKVAFTGGTALRIFHNLKRYSEDLDFMLMQPCEFDLNDYIPVVKKYLSVFGLNIDVREKKRKHSDIIAGLVVVNTKELYVSIFSEDRYSKDIYETQTTKIKIEVGKYISDRAGYKRVIKTTPYIHTVTLCDKPTLFAGKLHAILFREWKERIKGRDLYDFIFYSTREIPFNLDFLNDKMKASGACDKDLSFEEVIEMLKERFRKIDYNSAREDVVVFMNKEEISSLENWGPELFIGLTEDLSCQGEIVLP